MVGIRLVVGFVAMGILTPLLIAFLLDLRTPGQIITIAVCCFSAWAVADLVATILSRKKVARGSGRRMIETYISGSGDPPGD